MPTITDYRKKNKTFPIPLVFSLACLIKYYKENEPSDSKAAVEYIKAHDVVAILSNTDLWGADLSDMTDIVNESLVQIENKKIREAIQWSML